MAETKEKLTLAEFTERFRVHMLKEFEARFPGHPPYLLEDDGEISNYSVAQYAEDTAPAYYEDDFTDSPEEAAEADMDHWGDA